MSLCIITKIDWESERLGYGYLLIVIVAYSDI